MTLKQLDALISRKADLRKMHKKEADYRAGIISSVIANVNRDRKKKTQPYKPEDFVPKKKKQTQQSWQKQLKIVEFLNEAYGGKDLRNSKGGGAN